MGENTGNTFVNTVSVDAATMKEVVEVLGALLKRDGQSSPSGFESDCNCIEVSRAAEREYEAGECPHQRARALLAKLECGGEPDTPEAVSDEDTGEEVDDRDMGLDDSWVHDPDMEAR